MTNCKGDEYYCERKGCRYCDYPMCKEAREAEDGAVYRCTERRGHSGIHKAEGLRQGVTLYAWPNRKKVTE